MWPKNLKTISENNFQRWNIDSTKTKFMANLIQADDQPYQIEYCFQSFCQK